MIALLYIMVYSSIADSPQEDPHPLETEWLIISN